MEKCSNNNKFTGRTRKRWHWPPTALPRFMCQRYSHEEKKTNEKFFWFAMVSHDVEYLCLGLTFDSGCQRFLPKICLLLLVRLKEFMRFSIARMRECWYMGGWTGTRMYRCVFSTIHACAMILTVAQINAGLIWAATHCCTIDSVMLMAGCKTSISFWLGLSIEITTQRCR